MERAEFYRFLDNVPKKMQGYVAVDVEQMAEDWACDYLVVELRSGRVAMFETSA